MTSSATEWKRRVREFLEEFFGGRCEFCGNTQYLQFAHHSDTELNGMGRGSVARTKDIVNHPGCYFLLCGACHAGYDAGWRPDDLQLVEK